MNEIILVNNSSYQRKIFKYCLQSKFKCQVNDFDTDEFLSKSIQERVSASKHLIIGKTNQTKDIINKFLKDRKGLYTIITIENPGENIREEDFLVDYSELLSESLKILEHKATPRLENKLKTKGLYSPIPFSIFQKLQNFKPPIKIELQGKLISYSDGTATITEENFKKLEEKRIFSFYVDEESLDRVIYSLAERFSYLKQDLSPIPVISPEKFQQNQIQDLEEIDNIPYLPESVGTFNDREFMKENLKRMDLVNKKLQSLNDNRSTLELMEAMCKNGKKSKILYPERATAIALLLHGLCKQHPYLAETSSKTLLRAAFIFDLAIHDNNELLLARDYLEVMGNNSKFTKEEKERWLKHSAIAANTAKLYYSDDPNVYTICLYQHEQYNKKGHPLKLDHKKISPLVSLFIVAVDCINHKLLSEKFNIKTYVKKARLYFKTKNFTDALDLILEFHENPRIKR